MEERRSRYWPERVGIIINVCRSLLYFDPNTNLKIVHLIITAADLLMA